jgi:hypothetical protein
LHSELLRLQAKLQTRFFLSILLVNFWLEIVSRRVGFPIFRLAFFSDLNSCKQDWFFNFGFEHYFWLKSLQAGLVFQFWVSAFWLEFASKVFNIVCAFQLEFGKQGGVSSFDIVHAFWHEFASRKVFQLLLVHSDLNSQAEWFFKILS